MLAASYSCADKDNDHSDSFPAHPNLENPINNPFLISGYESPAYFYERFFGQWLDAKFC